MDAVDGKQARRTKSASMVGEFLDHTFDVIMSETIILIAAAVTRRANNTSFLLLHIYGFCSCLLPEWEKFYTGRLFTASFNGAVEGYFFAMGICLLAAYRVWLGLDVGDLIFLFISCYGLIEMLPSHIASVYNAKRFAKSRGLSRVATIYPAAISFVAMLLWTTSPWGSVAKHYYLFFIAFGFIAGRVHFLYLVYGACKSPLPHSQMIKIILPFVIGSLLANLPRLFPDAEAYVLLVEPIYLLAWSIVSSIEFVTYFVAMLSSFCNFLNVPFWTIRQSS